MTLVKEIIKNSLKSFLYDNTRIPDTFINVKGTWQDQFLALVLPKCAMIEMPDLDNDGNRPKYDVNGNKIGLMSDSKYIWSQLQWLLENDEECEKYKL